MQPGTLVLPLLLTGALGLGAPAQAPPAAEKPLTVYFIDVEGGQSTLIVSPSGESMLVDTGFPDFEDRDAGRILAAAKPLYDG